MKYLKHINELYNNDSINLSERDIVNISNSLRKNYSSYAKDGLNDINITTFDFHKIVDSYSKIRSNPDNIEKLKELENIIEGDILIIDGTLNPVLEELEIKEYLIYPIFDFNLKLRGYKLLICIDDTYNYIKSFLKENLREIKKSLYDFSVEFDNTLTDKDIKKFFYPKKDSKKYERVLLPFTFYKK